MADERSKAKRSYIMSRIRSRDTKPELLLRKALWAKNIRFRTHAKDLPGKPDIVIRKYKLAIFVDGEFWHGYDWENKKPTCLLTLKQVFLFYTKTTNLTIRKPSLLIPKIWAIQIILTR